MAKVKPPHHKGTYYVASERIRAAAYADPSTICWRCRRTLAEIRATKPKARWTAGHLVDGQIEGRLAAECSPCNFAGGARLAHESMRRKRTPGVSRKW